MSSLFRKKRKCRSSSLQCRQGKNWDTYRLLPHI